MTTITIPRAPDAESKADDPVAQPAIVRSIADRTQQALVVDDLHVTFMGKTRRTEAVRGVSLTVTPGKTLALLGESGSGKSVTARSILRLYGPQARTTGNVRLGDVDLLALDERRMRDMRGRRLAFVAQDATAALDPLRRVGSQVAEVLRVHRCDDSRRQARSRSEELLSLVGIPDPRRTARSFPHELSGGMRQRVAIAIAVACNPTVLIADEPTTALDVTVQAQVLALFERLQEELGMGLLLVTHDIGVAREVADHVAVMYAGRLVEEGPMASVLDAPSHPYTQGLLDSVPDSKTPRGQLRAIAGMPPSGADRLGTGCAFAARCPHASPLCTEDEPVLVELAEGRRAACPVMAPAPETLQVVS
jgi:oligopeptide/dipeptide ABC transporter ATP-binding protein